MVASTRPGRRTRGMEEKRSRIFDAARVLFAEHGFEGVTTQQVSDAADVATGTLFRYASSKSELLLMVYNEEFSAAIQEGERAAALAGTALEGVWALMRPVVDFAATNPGNTAMYQRELLFGVPGERYRDEGVALVARWEEAVARRIDADSALVSHEARLAARSLFAILNLAITDLVIAPDRVGDLRAQVDLVLAGLGAAPATE